ncbi:hypothetical protein RHMOL_Rhmol10G0093600 [Rhododendron molle]|uniref:Uncharacterized protein n=1 Tax=Rhododendron molle TaxID=49168 RepID=A0ACC0M1R6_RHOML|nr:hypothetical protein RHMOL_Rhmol10G0093600 [Rhododendron molle]
MCFHLLHIWILEFGRRLHPIINDLNLDNILIRMRKRTWTIACNEMPLTCLIFQEFIQLLSLRWTNYVLIMNTATANDAN